MHYPSNTEGSDMIHGTATSELAGQARIWTLTVPKIPSPGELIEWTEPAHDGTPRTVRGWVSSKLSPHAGAFLLHVAGEGTRHAIILVVSDDPPSATWRVTEWDGGFPEITFEVTSPANHAWHARTRDGLGFVFLPNINGRMPTSVERQHIKRAAMSYTFVRAYEPRSIS